MPKLRALWISGAAGAFLAAAGLSPALADYKVGFITSLSGPAATLGVPYSHGIAAAKEYMGAIGGDPVTLIQLDDGSDPAAATRDARKLIEEDKVDVLIGTATSTSSMAMAAVANELKVPYHRGFADQGAGGGRWRALGARGAAAAAADGQGRRRPHRARRREEARLYRLFRGLGRFRLQRRQGGGEAGRPAGRHQRALRPHRHHRSPRRR